MKYNAFSHFLGQLNGLTSIYALSIDGKIERWLLLFHRVEIFF